MVSVDIFTRMPVDLSSLCYHLVIQQCHAGVHHLLSSPIYRRLGNQPTYRQASTTVIMLTISFLKYMPKM